MMVLILEVEAMKLKEGIAVGGSNLGGSGDCDGAGEEPRREGS